MPWAAAVLAGSKWKGGGCFGVGNEEKERVLPNESFLLLSPYLYFNPFNDIMPSAPLTPSLYTYTLLL